jgi:hypothetical protein
MADISSMSDADLHALLSGGQQAAPDISTLSDADLHDLLSGKTASTSTTVARTAPESRSPLEAGLAGVVRGARDVIDPAARFLASQFGQGEPVAAGNANDLAAYENAYGGNTLSSVGRMAGQGIAMAPAMIAVNPVVGGAGRLLAAGVGRVAPAVGNALSAAGDFVGGAAGGPGQRLLQAGSRATQGAALGGEAGALASGQSDAPLDQQIASGAVTGAVLGPVAAGAFDAGRGIRRALTGAAAGAALPQEAAQLAQLARDQYGVMLKAPQIGLNPALRYGANALKMVPGSGAGTEAGVVQGQYNRAVARTFGEDSSKITPDVLSKAQARIGGVMNRIEGGANVSLDNTFMNDAAAIESNARASLTDHEFGVERRQLDNVMTNLQPGDTISGTTYGNLIHKGSPLDAALGSDNANIRNYAGQIKEALRDSLARSISPEDAAAYQQARTQYKNLKTVEPLTLRADTTGGPTPSIGDISPLALRGAVNRSFGTGVAQAAPGQVPLHDLARIGQFMKEPPSSGSGERGSMLMFGAKLAELGGAAATGHYLGLTPAAAGLVGGMLAGRGASSYLRSDFLARRMLNAALRPPTGNPLSTQLQPYIGPAGNILSGSPQSPESPPTP